MNWNRRSLRIGLPLMLMAAVLVTSLRQAIAEEDPRKAEPRPPQPVTELTEEEYYELLRLLADTLDQVERNYVKEVTRRELVEAAIDGVISKLDQYSNYIPPEDLDRFRSGVENEFGGIGIQVAIQKGWLTSPAPSSARQLIAQVCWRAMSSSRSKALARRASRWTKR